MVERLGRIEEARGSIPLTSTLLLPGAAGAAGAVYLGAGRKSLRPVMQTGSPLRRTNGNGWSHGKEKSSVWIESAIWVLPGRIDAGAIALLSMGPKLMIASCERTKPA